MMLEPQGNACIKQVHTSLQMCIHPHNLHTVQFAFPVMHTIRVHMCVSTLYFFFM